MSEAELTGAPAAPGVAAGTIRMLAFSDAADPRIPPERREDEAENARRALEEAAVELGSIAARLREEGRSAESEIVETGVLIAADPGLGGAIEAIIHDRGLSAAEAIASAANEYAQTLAELADPTLSARADDVRSLGRRAARLASGDSSEESAAASAEVIVIASDLGPADVAELGAEVRGVALSDGAVNAHAAILARSLGLPMVTGLGPDALLAACGTIGVVDGDRGSLLLAPDVARLARAREAAERAARSRTRARANRLLPATTRDGHTVAVLTNAAAAAEVTAGLAAGAEGIGLLRTELAFLEAREWPTEAEHRAALEPPLAAAAGLPATVRVLDFGGDKTPPFLADRNERGLELLLGAPGALAAQLRAALRAGDATRLRLLLPMVASADDVDRVDAALTDAVAAVPGATRPALGAMIETIKAVDAAAEIAERVDFLSIGTNDLTHSALGGDRFEAGEARTHDPTVLRAIAQVAEIASAAGIPLEVCGEAASDARIAPLLVGFGVDELSVGAARVGAVRDWIRRLDFARAEAMARSVLRAGSAAEVDGIVRPAARALESLDQLGDTADEGLNRGLGVASLAPKS